MPFAAGCPLLMGTAWLEEEELGLELWPDSTSEANAAESSRRETFCFPDLPPCKATL